MSAHLDVDGGQARRLEGRLRLGQGARRRGLHAVDGLQHLLRQAVPMARSALQHGPHAHQARRPVHELQRLQQH